MSVAQTLPTQTRFEYLASQIAEWKQLITESPREDKSCCLTLLTHLEEIAGHAEEIFPA